MVFLQCTFCLSDSTYKSNNNSTQLNGVVDTFPTTAQHLKASKSMENQLISVKYHHFCKSFLT